jgi:hypothetical protein
MLPLKRGEVIVGRDHLAAVWNWTPSKVRTFLPQLVAAERLEFRQSNGHHPNVAKITNYRRFQDFDATPAPVKSPVNSPEDRQSVASGSPHPYKEQETVVAVAAAPKQSKDSDRATLDQALADYNQAAEAIGFARCTALTEQRAKTLAKRLADLGQGDMAKGAERFRDALAAIPHDRFLAGKAPPRAGSKPFRLDLDRLLSTGSGMGDVLGKLLDLHDEHGPAPIAEPNSSRRSSLDEQVRDAMAEHQTAERARWNESADMEAPRDFH